ERLGGFGKLTAKLFRRGRERREEEISAGIGSPAGLPFRRSAAARRVRWHRTAELIDGGSKVAIESADYAAWERCWRFAVKNDKPLQRVTPLPTN
ncbi:hypothetical protein K0M31_014445, partial [Melipona bicolor]